MIKEFLQDLDVPSEVKSFRLERICKECPSLLNKEDTTMKTWRCGECKCFLYVKGALKDFTCPLGKW